MTIVIQYSGSCLHLDGLVKRLEELERTAELYKGKLCLSSDTMWGGKMPTLCFSEMTSMSFSVFHYRLDRTHQESSQSFL